MASVRRERGLALGLTSLESSRSDFDSKGAFDPRQPVVAPPGRGRNLAVMTDA